MIILPGLVFSPNSMRASRRTRIPNNEQLKLTIDMCVVLKKACRLDLKYPRLKSILITGANERHDRNTKPLVSSSRTRSYDASFRQHPRTSPALDAARITEERIASLRLSNWNSCSYAQVHVSSAHNSAPGFGRIVADEVGSNEECGSMV